MHIQSWLAKALKSSYESQELILKYKIILCPISFRIRLES